MDDGEVMGDRWSCIFVDIWKGWAGTLGDKPILREIRGTTCCGRGELSNQ